MPKTKRSVTTLLVLLSFSCLILFTTIWFARDVNSDSPAPVIQTGWQTEENSKYYVLTDGSRATGWQEIDGKTYYFRSSGSMVTGWLNLDGQVYYFLENGHAASGSVTIGNDVHYFAEKGLPRTGWFQAEDGIIYLDSTGKMVTGWHAIDEKLYYLDEDGHTASGWLELDGKTYYLKEDGSAARGRFTIDKTVHYFASNGEEIILVNPWNYLPEDYTVELTRASNNYQVAKIASADLKQMLADCKAAGCVPVICSAYRTWEYQKKLYDRKVKKLLAEGMTQEEAEQQAGTVVAIPGTSEHQLGLALDIIDDNNWALDESQENTKTQKWLMAHSWEYGWVLRYPNGKSEITGIIYEPWHYRYVGREIASELHELDMCLEEYLQMLTETVG